MKNVHRLQTSAIQRPHCSITSKHSHKIAKKQKFVYEEDDDQQTLTLRNEFNVIGKSSTSKLLESTQSNSYHSHSKKKIWRRDFSSKHVHRNWSYGVNDSSDYKGVENASKHPDLYPKVPYKYMKWNHRLETICMELAQYDSSILCFQEVDCFSDLSYALQHDGFEGVLKARTGDARDGCAIFWKHDRFKLLHEENIEFRKFGLRDNVAQFCVLEVNDGQINPDLKMSKSTLVVGNTHILFNPNRGDIKLGQIRLFLEWAHKLSEEWGGIPVVLAGDFNSVPQSAVYQYISSAKLNILQHDRKRVSGQLEIPLCHSSSTKESFRKRPFTYKWNDEELKLATGREMVTYLQHNLNLHSAYHGVPGSNTTRDNVGEPLATSCHSKFMGTVDYIWHNDQLVPVKVLETLSRKALGKVGGLPNKIIEDMWNKRNTPLHCLAHSLIPKYYDEECGGEESIKRVALNED